MDKVRPAGGRPDTGRRRRPAETLARARELFLAAEGFDSGAVRDAILASWARSREWRVSADPFELPYHPDLDRTSELAHSAAGVLAVAEAQSADEPVAIVLTDAAGNVLDRRTGDGALRRKLDQVSLAPGFSYAEQFAGTNGIGTALESRGPAEVFGHEHYVEHLEELACAGTPIHHPVTGKLVGILDLTCWRKDANEKMIMTANTLARRIEEALLASVGHREFALLRQYLAASRNSRVPALAVSDDLVMMNDRARELIDPRDQAALLGQAVERMSGSKPLVFTTVLPSGATAKVQCHPNQADPRIRGGVIQVHLGTAEPATRTVPSRAPKLAAALPGAVGSSQQWSTCCQGVEAQLKSGEWLDLVGEAGVGKLAVARGTHLAHTPALHLRILDAEACGNPRDWLREVAGELAGRSGTLILRHVDRLPGPVLVDLAVLLEGARQPADRSRMWVVSTRRAGADVSEELDRLVWCFPSSVEVPPLRHRIEDLPEIVELFFARVGSGSGLTCAPEAIRALMHNRWPGNIEQLFTTLRKVVAHRRTGVISTADLPAECLATTRRVLSPLESIECDAVVAALLDAAGDRAKAARSLGLSRATIYRKIRDYGIAVPSQPAR